VPSRCKRQVKNESAPDSLSHGTLVEQPSPEVCSQPPYVLIRTVGMALMCHPKMIIGRRLSPLGRPAAMPSNIHCRLRLSPSRCANLGRWGRAKAVIGWGALQFISSRDVAFPEVRCTPLIFTKKLTKRRCLVQPVG
jgi:hypothetical protein